MNVLLQRIAELERKVARVRQQRDELRRSRDMWKERALSYGRGGAGWNRRAA